MALDMEATSTKLEIMKRQIKNIPVKYDFSNVVVIDVLCSITTELNNAFKVRGELYVHQ